MKQTFTYAGIFIVGILVAVVTTRLMEPSGAPSPTVEVSGETTSFVVPHESNRERRLDSYADAIRDLDFDYGKVGSVLEAIGYLELKERFPAPQYEVVASVQYFNASRRTLGELDLVVVDVPASKVVVAYEAKLTGNPEAASRRAAEQISRFKRYLREGEVYQFLGRPGDLPLKVEYFSESTPMLRMGSRETEAYGWEAIVDLGRSEGDRLQAAVRGG